MTGRVQHMLDRVPAWILVPGAALLIAPLAWWAFKPLAEQSVFATHIASAENTTADRGEQDQASIPPAALTVTLRDELFDTPPAPPAPPPPPLRLDLELIAITGIGDDRSAFVHAPSAGEYMDLKPGERTDQGAVVVEIGDAHLLLRLGEREIRLELSP